MPTPRRWCPSWAEKPPSPAGTKSSYRRSGQRRSPPLRRGRTGRLGPGCCAESWCSLSGSPCLGRTRRFSLICGGLVPNEVSPGGRGNHVVDSGGRAGEVSVIGIIREVSGGTGAGTFRKTPGEGKGLLEPSGDKEQKVGGHYRWSGPHPGYYFHAHPLCAQPVTYPNATCVTGPPARAPTHRMVVNWDGAIQVLSPAPDPQSVSSTCWH